MKKRILFIISDTGGGHRSAAKAIIAGLRELRINVDCEMIDLLRASHLPGICNAPEIYSFFSTRHIWIYNLIFRLSNFSGYMNWASNLLYRFARDHIRQAINTYNPHLVVVIHPLAVRPVCNYRDETGADWPILTVVTDLASIHASWATPRADLFLLPTWQAFQRFRQLGVPEQKIIVTGFPIHPRFTNISLNQTEARQQLGLPADGFIVLLTSGGAGGGPLKGLVEQIEHHCPECILLAVTGRNQATFSLLKERADSPQKTIIFQFVDNMELLMVAADVVVTKAGPGTIMEAACLQRPLILTGAVGLQEEGNLDFVTENGWGYSCITPAAVVEKIEEIKSRQNIHKSLSLLPSAVSGTQMIVNTLLDAMNNKLEHSPDSPSTTGGNHHDFSFKRD